jgi:hypothetical protein
VLTTTTTGIARITLFSADLVGTFDFPPVCP